MDKREKAIKGLECISGAVVWCAHCPYSGVDGYGRGERCKRDAAKDALELLKAKVLRVMTLKEVDALDDGAIIYSESRYKADDKWATEIKPAIFQATASSPEEDGYYCIVSTWERSGFYHVDNYGFDWRCWTSRPTDAQREAEPWNS